MKRVAFYYWRIRDERAGKMRKTTSRMREEEASRYPGAEKIESALPTCTTAPLVLEPKDLETWLSGDATQAQALIGSNPGNDAFKVS